MSASSNLVFKRGKPEEKFFLTVDNTLSGEGCYFWPARYTSECDGSRIRFTVLRATANVLVLVILRNSSAKQIIINKCISVYS